MDQINGTGESFQLVALELIRKVCRTSPFLKAQYIKSIHNLANTGSNAVAFEAANTLISLSSAPVAIRAAISAYTRLLNAESDSNVMLTILNRLSSLKNRYEKILQEMIMDILRTLTNPNIDIRRKTLELALYLISPRNVEEVVQLLKKELIKTESPEQGKSDEYRKLLVNALHRCAVKFPEVVAAVTQVLLNYIGDDNNEFSLSVTNYIREIVEEYPQVREDVVLKLSSTFDDIRASDVYRVALWVLGEYATEAKVLGCALDAIRNSVGELPLLAPKVEEKVEEKKDVPEIKAVPAKVAPKNTVLADGK